jgi:CcmD family protein
VIDFLSQNSLYVVLAVVLAIWFGILFYLFRIEKRVARLEKELPKS